MINVRNYVKGEQLPQRLCTGYESGENTLPEWIWVAERDGKITAILITSPAHVAVLIIRMISMPEAGPNDIRALLISACAEMKNRGYHGYFTWLDPTQEIERALLSIFRHTGGTQFMNPQVLCAGRV